MTDSDPTSKRIHITLSAQKEEQLSELAAQHHNGNTSGCVRAAVEAYRLSLEGGSVEAIRKLKNSVEKTNEELTELRELVEDSNKEDAVPQPTSEPQPHEALPSESIEDVPEGIKSEIHQYLLDTDEKKASVSEIAEAVNTDTLTVDSAARLLCAEYGFIENIEEDEAKKYKIT